MNETRDLMFEFGAWRIFKLFSPKWPQSFDYLCHLQNNNICKHNQHYLFAGRAVAIKTQQYTADMLRADTKFGQTPAELLLNSNDKTTEM